MFKIVIMINLYGHIRKINKRPDYYFLHHYRKKIAPFYTKDKTYAI